MYSYTLHFSSKSDEEILKEFSVAEERISDETGCTPLIAAIHLGRRDLVERMLTLGFSPKVRTLVSSPIGTAIDAANPYADIILNMLLIKYGPLNEEHPRDFCGELNEPMLHAAIRRGKKGTAEILIQHGAKLSWMDTECVTGYELAREFGLELEGREC